MIDRPVFVALIGMSPESVAAWPARLPPHTELRTAPTLTEALPLLTRHPFDLAIVDLSTPDLATISPTTTAELRELAVIIVGDHADYTTPPATPFAHVIETLQREQCASEVTRKLLTLHLAHLRLHRRFRHMQRMRAVGHFARGMAHEFNNLLTGVIGYGELLQQGPVAEDLVLMSVPEILRAAQQMALLTQQIRTYGRRKLARADALDINRFLTELLPEWRQTLGPDIHIELQAQPRLPPCKIDPSALETILDELLMNSQEALANHGTITLRTEKLDLPSQRFKPSYDWQPGSYVLIELEDNGPGIDDALLERIFEPFFTTRATTGNSGMGLTVARAILKQHTSFLIATSVPLRGARFSLFLPVAR